MFMDTHCTYTESFHNNRHCYHFSGECPICKKSKMVAVNGPELFSLRQGKHIQEALTSCSAGEREFLISGICGECFDKMFSE